MNALFLFVFTGALLLLALMFYNMLLWPRVSRDAKAYHASVSVLIPARNEELNISAALESVLSQSDVEEVLVYDDHSTDGTAECVKAAARQDTRVRLIAPQPLPEGWYGKPFACSRLAAEARGEWLLFMDADARLQPGAVARIVSEAERRGLTFLGVWPGIEMCGFWEKLFMPLLNFVVFTLFPAPLSLKMKLPALGLAHGACILIHHMEYRQTGGHALVKGELFEDTALARAWRAQGLAGLCLDGQDAVRVRMYDSLGAIWQGFEKCIYPAFRCEASFWLFLAFHFTFFVLPFAIAPALAAGGMVSISAWGAVVAALASRTVQAFRFGYPFWSILFHPVGECALLAVALTSWTKCRAGLGIEWKGRTYRGKNR